MTLASGGRLGSYEILGSLGAGAMGEVYRATDSNLKREVAIKVLPASVAGDSDRLARFQREAEVLASLNHPNIAAIYGLEKSGGMTALVMELVEGPTLAERITGRSQVANPKGQIPTPTSQVPTSNWQGLPLDEALAIARQITHALEAAHELGIVHRDLKPANVKVRGDGTVKVLDFGLAKAMAPAGPSSVLATNSPTITTPAMTQAGIILGTAAYMSPEQARGKPVDRRADIWAFGCVLFEMLTGQRAFGGEDITVTLARVVEREPDFDILPAAVPARVRQTLRLCLLKDPKQRVGDIRDVRLALDGAFETTASQAAAPATAPSRGSRVTGMAAAAGVTGAIALAGAFGFMSSRDLPVPPRVSFEVRADVSGGGAVHHFALAPDGSSLVARVSSPGGSDRLWLRRLDGLGGSFLDGTENAAWPCWSPDGRSIAFARDNRLYVTDVSGWKAPGAGRRSDDERLFVERTAHDPVCGQRTRVSRRLRGRLQCAGYADGCRTGRRRAPVSSVPSRRHSLPVSCGCRKP